MKTFWEIREGKYVGGPEYTWPQNIGANNSPQAKKIKAALKKAGHQFKDFGDLPANKKANKHYITMKDKAGYAALMKLLGKKESEEVSEAKVECPQCEGKGCNHCDDKGYHMEDSDAVKAFLAKGGKIKRLPPGKAAGYHGKDDPGHNVYGVLGKKDSSKFKRGKKVRSMRADMSEAVAVDAKKMDTYKKFAKVKNVDHDSIRMAMDNPNDVQTKRMMKDKNFATALRMYKAAMK